MTLCQNCGVRRATETVPANQYHADEHLCRSCARIVRRMDADSTDLKAAFAAQKGASG